MSLRNGLLALLVDGPTIGYQLKRGFEDVTAGMWPVNGGQIYTTLQRLVRDGLVEVDEPSAGGADGDDQRRYRITAEGASELRRWIDTPRPPERFDRDDLVIKVAFALATPGLADRQTVLSIVDAQRERAFVELATLTRRKASLGHGGTPQLVVVEAAIARLEAELKWLDRVEFAATLEPGSDGAGTASPPAETGEHR